MSHLFEIWYRVMFPHLYYGGYDYTDLDDMEQTQLDIDTFWYFLNGEKL
jgi:hypothetical protein